MSVLYLVMYKNSLYSPTKCKCEARVNIFVHNYPYCYHLPLTTYQLHSTTLQYTHCTINILIQSNINPSYELPVLNNNLISLGQ